MLATAVGIIAVLTGLSSIGVWNHVDTPAWESEVVKVQQQIWQQDFDLNQLRRRGIQNDLYNNQGQQAQFKLHKQLVPDFYLKQQLELQNELDTVNKRIDTDQAKINSGAPK